VSAPLAIEPGRAGFDIDVPHAKVLDMPLKFGLELVPIIGSHGVNAKRKPLDNVVEKKHRIGLGVLLVNLESTDPGCIENGGPCGRPQFASPGILHRPGRDAREPAFHSGSFAQCGVWHYSAVG
jgi:hypothetical protein